VPTQNAVVLLWFFFLAASVPVLAAPPPAPVVPRRAAAALSAAAVLLAIAYTAWHAVLARGPLALAERATRFAREYVDGAYAPEPLPDGTTYRWIDDDARFILPARGEAVMIRVWAHHPDIREHPVSFALSSRCGEVIRRELTSPEPVAVGVLIPAGIETLDVTVTASRTWSPADGGGGDTRQLGVAVWTDFVDRRLAETRDYHVDWPVCR
jgi:hypothetical protein